MEDRSILKRRYPFEKKTQEPDDKAAKEQTEDILPSLPQADDKQRKLKHQSGFMNIFESYLRWE